MTLTPRCKHCGKQLTSPYLQQEALCSWLDVESYCDEKCLNDYHKNKWRKGHNELMKGHS